MKIYLKKKEKKDSTLDIQQTANQFDLFSFHVRH